MDFQAVQASTDWRKPFERIEEMAAAISRGRSTDSNPWGHTFSSVTFRSVG